MVSKMLLDYGYWRLLVQMNRLYRKLSMPEKQLVKNPTNQPKQSSAIKEAVPWETVAALLDTKGIPSNQRKSR